MSAAASIGLAVGLTGLLAASAVHARSRDALLLRAGCLRLVRPERGPRGHGLSRRLRLLLRPLFAALGLGVGSVLAGAPGGAAGLVGALVVPIVSRRRRASRREEAMETQMAEAVASISAALRAGQSLPQAIGYAADEAQPPLGPSLRSVVDRIALGVPLDDSLERWAASEPSADVRLIVGVLRLHNRTGGDLPGVLDQLGRTLRERRAAAREVRSLTAQARMSGAILGFLPVGFFLFLSATSRQDIAAAYHSPAGAAAIALGLAMEGVAFLWIQRLLRVTG